MSIMSDWHLIRSQADSTTYFYPPTVVSELSYESSDRSVE